MSELSNPLASDRNKSEGIERQPIDAIRVFRAKTHNLQQVDVEIPLGKMTVITGVSGSGKSSLAIDTIFAEGRYRYFSSLSNRSRELMQSIDRPDVESIDYLPPVLHIEQPQRAARKRSTIATISEIHEFLRLLYARVGQLHCPECGEPVSSQTRSEIVRQVLAGHERQKIIIMAPVVRATSGTHSDVFTRIVKDGYVRARVDGEIVDAASPPELAKSKPHDIEIVIDRLILKDGIQERLVESIDLALQLGQGQCIISCEVGSGWRDQLFSTQLACRRCGVSYPTLEPRTFSFNSAAGACPTCQGLGAVAGREGEEQTCNDCGGKRLGRLGRAVEIDGTSITDFCSLTASAAMELVDRWSKQSELPDEARAAGGSMTDRKAAMQFTLPEVVSRLQFLIEIGLDYLTLDRGGETLSFGEFQRTRLTGCLGNRLTGVCYILDEPTAGLHFRDLHRLLKILTRLRDDGNTLLLVEHDLELIRHSDHLIELGPGAGRLGGRVVAIGTPQELAQNPDAITGRFLSDDSGVQPSVQPIDEELVSPLAAPNSEPPHLRLTGATLHNLKNVTFDIPLQRLVVVTGVSGSGKSSLVMQTVVPAVRRALGERCGDAGPFDRLTGVETLIKLIRVDQSPLGRSARSNPATYTGLWDEVRKVFAKTKDSRIRGFHSRNFSLSDPGARCPECAGRGCLPVDEQRFANWDVPCPACNGQRFSPVILSVHYRGLSVADVLELTFAEGAEFFQNFPRLSQTMSVMMDLGLGYLRLGQAASTLSGGEAQRIKLATELAKSSGLNGASLFVLDEPTSGLHAADVQQLVQVLRRLVSQGHSVVIVEHNQQLIKSADWIVEIGPGPGVSGGQILFSGKLK